MIDTEAAAYQAPSPPPSAKQTQSAPELIKALAAVMAEVGAVAKRGENKFHGYSYATAADVVHALQPLMAKHGVIVIQSERGREFLHEGSVLAINYEFILAHSSGQAAGGIFRTGMAAARNSKGGFDDKCVNKCHTSAHKYFLITQFEIPTGDYADPDGDEAPPPPQQAKGPKPAAPKPAAKAAPKTEAPVHPETGEIGPHEIQSSDAVDYGAKLVAAVNAAISGEEIDAWLEANKSALAELEEEAPKIKKRIDERTAEKRAALGKAGAKGKAAQPEAAAA